MIGALVRTGLAVLVCSVPALGADAADEGRAPLGAGALKSGSVESSCPGDRHRAGCLCADRWPARHAGSGLVARDCDRDRHRDDLDVPALQDDSKRARVVTLRRHGSGCQCGGCASNRRNDRDPDHGRHHDRDRPVVLAGGRPVVVSTDGDATRYLLDQVSVKSNRRTDGVLAISGAGGDVLVRGACSPVVRDEDGGARAGSGSLYLHVRADGRLEIRSR